MVAFPLCSPHPGWPGLENVRDTHDAAGLVCAGLALHTVAQRFGCPVNRVPGAVVGGLFLGLIESVGSIVLGPEHAVTLSFSLLIVFLIVRPHGLLGKRGFE